MIPAVVLELDYNRLTDLTGEAVETALVRSINKVTDRLRTKAAKVAREQVNFPASYLSPSGQRLWVKQRARKSAMEAIIEGRGRPTSLARFATTTYRKKRKDNSVPVMVAPGQKRLIKRGFLIKLRNGNIGLAVRTNGGAPPGAYKPKEISKNLWLLYGPSVDQALQSASNGGGIFEDLQIEALDELEDEFTRQLKVLNAI